MACESCGEKKACDKSFTKAIVEIDNPSEFVQFRKVVVPASLGDDTAYPPIPGKYCNAILYYEANEQVYIYSSDGIPTRLTTDVDDIRRDIQGLKDEDIEIWNEIETIEASSDVVDVVGTYAELQQYDTSKLHDKDLIKVLQDETHDDAITYYRWSTSTHTFSYVGAEGPYYTVSETDALLGDKQDTLVAGSNIQIDSETNTISATDTTYTHFTGATASTDGVQGLVPGPLAGDEDKFLKGDGTWADASYNVFAYNADGLVPAPGSSSYRLYLLDDASWTPQIVNYVPSISSDGTSLYINPKMSNGLNYTTYTYDLKMTGATSSANGKTGFVPRPLIADRDKFLKGDGTWGTVSGAEMFYINNNPFASPISTLPVYKDDALTTAATYAELAGALSNGPVIFKYIGATTESNFIVSGSSFELTGLSYDSIELAIQDNTSICYLGDSNNPATTDPVVLDVGVSHLITSLPAATASVAGIGKLYTTTGQNEDGAVTQKLFTDTVGNIETALQILNSGSGV